MACITIRVARIVTSSTTPMMSPERRPMNTSNTTMTMPIACARLTTKLLMASVTTSPWKKMKSRFKPSGVRGSSSASRSRTSSPITTTLPPDTVEMPRPMAGLPL
jgi:hypothetical protein